MHGDGYCLDDDFSGEAEWNLSRAACCECGHKGISGPNPDKGNFLCKDTAELAQRGELAEWVEDAFGEKLGEPRESR